VENKKKLALIILDGWGYGRNDQSNAILAANTPFVDGLLKQYPNSKLEASGTAVGLPAGQMGNSEVGHMNLGAGRVVYQELGRIHKAVDDNELPTIPVLKDAFEYAKQNNKDVHFIGLVSDGGVHSHIRHVKGLCDAAKQLDVNNVYIHAFLDGRDTDPKSGLGFVTELEEHIAGTGAKIASAIGRYYAMDRDNRWERVKLAYDLMVNGIGTPTQNVTDLIKHSYLEGVTDEFVKPIVAVDSEGKPLAVIKDGDVVICFNFRTDRCREITQVLSQTDMPEFGMKKLSLHYTTMTDYDRTFKNVSVIFENDNLNNTLGEILANNGKKQIRIAETEKYPHVSFFFSGGRETPFEGERRILIQSPKVATYDLKPEMSANEVTDAIVPEIEKESADFICLNFANADMVGHTGVFSAVIKAVETVDKCVERVVTAALEHGYSIFLTADHGNADYEINEDGSPNTAHTMNPVPLFIIDKNFKGAVKAGKLGDIAPTILTMMHLPIPHEMTGEVLI